MNNLLAVFMHENVIKFKLKVVESISLNQEANKTLHLFLFFCKFFHDFSSIDSYNSRHLAVQGLTRFINIFINNNNKGKATVS